MRVRPEKQFALLKRDPEHPSLHLKPLVGHADVWSVRVSKQYRALGRRRASVMYWFWIGHHAEYDKRTAKR